MELNPNEHTNSELKSTLFRSLDLQENPQRFSIDELRVVPEVYLLGTITTTSTRTTTKLSDLSANSRSAVHFTETGDIVSFAEEERSITPSKKVREYKVDRKELPKLESIKDCIYYAASDNEFAEIEYNNQRYVAAIKFRVIGDGEFMSPLLDERYITFKKRYYQSVQSQISEYQGLDTGKITSSNNSRYFQPDSTLTQVSKGTKIALSTTVAVFGGLALGLTYGWIGILLTLFCIGLIFSILWTLIPTKESRKRIKIGNTLENSAPVSEIASLESTTVIDLIEYYHTREEVKNHNSQLPSDVTVEISSENITLISESENTNDLNSDTVWDLQTTDNGTYTEDVVSFFKYLGFEKDLEGMVLETQAFPTDKFIDDSVPTLKSTDNNWVLVPEMINTPSEKDLPDEPTISHITTENCTTVTESQNNDAILTT